MEASPAEEVPAELLRFPDEVEPLATRQPTESLLSFFTPEGWGEAINLSGATAARAAETLVDIMTNSEDDRARLAALDMLLKHNRAVLTYANVFGEETTHGVLRVTDGERSSLELHRTARHISLAKDAAQSSEDLLLEAATAVTTTRHGDSIDSETENLETLALPAPDEEDPPHE